MHADVPASREHCTGLWPWLDDDHLNRGFEVGPCQGCPVVWGPGLCR